MLSFPDVIGIDGDTLNFYDPEANTDCSSTVVLPSAFSDAFLAVFRGRLLACELASNHLCYLYSGSEWELYWTNDSGFNASEPVEVVNMEDHGILFMQGSKGLILSLADGFFHKRFVPSYPDSCATYVPPNSVAFIGGSTIKVYNFQKNLEEFTYDLNSARTGASCINVPKGIDGDPSVLIGNVLGTLVAFVPLSPAPYVACAPK